MADLSANKRIVRDFISAVWEGQNLAALATFWAEDCVNHAMPKPDNRGLAALRAYHEQFFADFSAFSHVRIEVVQQVEEGERVVTQLTTRGEHSELFYGIPPTGKDVSLATIRIDRLEDGKIAEHWSVADVAGLMQQLQT
jgi:steroid delta-isomerase-like uncharacterized protein